MRSAPVGACSPGGSRKASTKERVDVLFGYLGERRVKRDAEITLTADLAVYGLEYHVDLGGGAFHAQAHQAEARSFVKDHDQNNPRGDDGDVKIVALAFVREHGNRSLPF